MTAELLAAIAGTVLSLAFSYIPGLSTWYSALEETYKRLIMLGLLVLTAAAVFGLACAQWFSVPVTCDQTGLEGLLLALFWAATGNQVTYRLTKRSR